MTAYLLDTHALVWAVHQPERLGAQALAVVKDPQSSLSVSAASAWELATKHRIGKLPGAGGLLATLEAHIARLGARPLDMTVTHALLAGQLDWAHRDPFDRMLAAQALVESCPLISADAAFASLPGLRTVW